MNRLSGARIDVPHAAELGRDAGDVHGDGLRAVVHLHRVRVLARDGAQSRGLPPDRLDVVFVDADLASLAEALERDRGQARPGDADAVADARGVDDHLPLHALAEGEQQGHGDRAPDDAEDGQEGAQLLAAHVAPHLADRVAKREHGRSVSRRQSTAEVSFLGGRSTTFAPMARPSVTCVVSPSETPSLTATFFGGSFAVAAGSSTKVFFPPSSKMTTRSGIVGTSLTSRMIRSALAE